jgi:hypothetical protein
MKLYSLLQDVILEAIRMTSNGINGTPTNEMIKDILENPRRVTIMYQGSREEKPSERQIDVIAFGTMKGTNNKAIRVYQPFGYSTKTTSIDGKGFKTLLLSNITYWQPTKLAIWNTNAYDAISSEIGRINKSGDESFSTIYGISNFVTGKKTSQQPIINKPQPVTNNKPQPVVNKTPPVTNNKQKTYNNITNPNNKELSTKKTNSRYED